MEFFDCNCCIGLPKVAPPRPLATAADITDDDVHNILHLNAEALLGVTC